MQQQQQQTVKQRRAEARAALRARLNDRDLAIIDAAPALTAEQRDQLSHLIGWRRP